MTGVKSVETIERELASMRLGDDGVYDMRASVLNLIVVADEELAGEVSGVISRLSGRHPSRSVILITDDDAPRDDLDVRLSTMCNVPGPEGRHVCSEQILLRAEGEYARHPESLVDPLLIPDLPVFLWCPGEVSLESPEFRRLAGLAERLILDSATDRDCEQALANMARFVGRGDRPYLGDLQWTALSPWRSFIAALYDPPERAAARRDLRRVRVEHRPSGLCRALLAAGWISSALGREPEGARRTGAGRAFAFSGGLEMELEPLESDAELPVISMESGEVSFEISVGRLTIREGGTEIERAVYLEAPGTGDLLGEELQFFGRDEAYEAALESAARLVSL
jgi:glucose-6-phosphate dehydrogenase assembly protein OpcA